jgi:uncharacterized RDD family membrane protein YckC
VAPPLRRRLGSLLYEVLVIVALVLPVVVVFTTVTFALPHLPRQRPILLALCLLAVGSYFAYCWRNGQTLAMRAWRIRVQDDQGRPPTLARALLRFACAWLWVLPPFAVLGSAHPNVPDVSSTLGLDAAATLAWVALWALLSFLHPERQFWHDALAGTRLVSTQ